MFFRRLVDADVKTKRQGAFGPFAKKQKLKTGSSYGGLRDNVQVNDACPIFLLHLVIFCQDDTDWLVSDDWALLQVFLHYLFRFAVKSNLLI